MFKKIMKIYLLVLFFSGAVCYSDDLARNKMLPMAAAAYAGNPGECVRKIFPNGSLHIPVLNKCDVTGNSCSGFDAVSHTDKAIILSFRGTRDWIQIMVEGSMIAFQNMSAFGKSGQVATYFLNAFNSLWIDAGMKDNLNRLKNRYPDYDFWITGHSLGGAMAALAAATIVSTNIKPASNVFVYTFGQPRTGNAAYAMYYDSLNITTYRVIHSVDLIPHVPPLGYGNLNYYHHKAEVWYELKMDSGAKYIVCDNVDEDNTVCSDSLSDIVYDITEHYNYFTKNVSSYGERGC